MRTGNSKPFYMLAFTVSPSGNTTRIFVLLSAMIPLTVWRTRASSYGKGRLRRMGRMAVRVSFLVSCWALPCSMACRRWRRSFFFIKALIFVMRILSLPMGNAPTAKVGDPSKSCETPPNVEVFFQQSRISTSLSWNFRRQISRNSV